MRLTLQELLELKPNLADVSAVGSQAPPAPWPAMGMPEASCEMAVLVVPLVYVKDVSVPACARHAHRLCGKEEGGLRNRPGRPEPVLGGGCGRLGEGARARAGVRAL